MSNCGYLPSVRRFWGRADCTQYADFELSEVEFDNCHFPPSSEAGRWNSIRRAKVTDIVNFNSSADTVCFDEVSVQNLKRTGRGPLFLWGCVFRHVTLSGNISFVKFNRSIGSDSSSNTQFAWDRAMIEFYRDVDWALDISQAKFSAEMTFEGKRRSAPTLWVAA